MYVKKETLCMDVGSRSATVETEKETERSGEEERLTSVEPRRAKRKDNPPTEGTAGAAGQGRAIGQFPAAALFTARATDCRFELFRI